MAKSKDDSAGKTPEGNLSPDDNISSEELAQLLGETASTSFPSTPQPAAAQLPIEETMGSLNDEISLDELEALVGTSATASKSSPQPINDSISPEELAALQETNVEAFEKTPAKAKTTSPTPAATATKKAANSASGTSAATNTTAPSFSGLAPIEGDSYADLTDTGLNLLMDVPLRVSVELGRITMTIQQVIGLGRGSIIELERLAGEPVDILVNDKVIGHGEVVVVDEYFGVKITELIEPKG
jgi:flagellar motor switch protein FliN